MLKLDSFWLKCKQIYLKTIKWFLKYEKQILLLVGFVVVVMLSFIFGVLQGTQLVQRPIMVTSPISEPVIIKESCNNDAIVTTKDCIYVGSIKGKKYYPPSCSFAKKISKENLRCFKSDEDAKSKGYTKSNSCT